MVNTTNKKLLCSLVYLFIGLLGYLFIPAPIFAAGEFQADYNVQYAISPTGAAIVTQNITLTNKQTNLYPQKYSILLDTTKIKNVIAYDGRSIVPTEITQKDGKTQIFLTFNDKVVGLGKQLSFTLRFENGDIAQQNGTVWEVNVPGVTQDADIASYNVTLSVPSSFGKNAYMSPLPAAGTTWTKEQMMAGGISAAYGERQSFDLALSYYLSNPAVVPARMSIALPPDTAYQTVVVKSLTPKPETVVRDDDGNWLAQYQLLPGTGISIEAAVRVDITLNPKPAYQYPAPDYAVYTRPQQYWEVQDPKIQELAKKYTTPRAIYDYVVSALAYDYTRVQAASPPVRKGAVLALATPKNSVCMEFSDLFIAIARAAGIPARQAVGYAYTTNTKLRPLSLVADILHAWPEYWDKEKGVWIPVDPTWANTTGGVNYFDKLDFNHIVFAVQGTSSDAPYPAGFYRKPGKTTRDVNVGFSAVPFTAPTGKLDTTIRFPGIITAGITARGDVTLANVSGVAVQSATIAIRSAPVDVGILRTEPEIPPFGRVTIPLTMTVPNYFSAGRGSILASVDGQTKSFSFAVQPITAYFLVPILSFSGILIILLSLLWFRRRKK